VFDQDQRDVATQMRSPGELANGAGCFAKPPAPRNALVSCVSRLRRHIDHHRQAAASLLFEVVIRGVVADVARLPRWTFRFTTTSAPWLNAVAASPSHEVVDLQAAINRFVVEHALARDNCQISPSASVRPSHGAGNRLHLASETSRLSCGKAVKREYSFEESLFMPMR
jgi:hypothetical protein